MANLKTVYSQNLQAIYSQITKLQMVFSILEM